MPSIYDPIPVLSVPEPWRTEFRGFFMGEGNASLLAYPRKRLKVYSYRPQLAIRLRDDEGPLLEQIKGYLGGFLTTVKARMSKAGYMSNPTTLWAISGWGPCRAILEQVLLGTVLLAHKRYDLELLHEAILYRYTLGGRLGQEGRAKMAEYRLAIMAVRKYSGCKSSVS